MEELRPPWSWMRPPTPISVPRAQRRRAAGMPSGWAGALAIASVALWITAPWTHGTGFALGLGMAPALGLLIARNYDVGQSCAAS